MQRTSWRCRNAARDHSLMTVRHIATRREQCAPAVAVAALTKQTTQLNENQKIPTLNLAWRYVRREKCHETEG